MNILKAGYEILTPISNGGIDELKHIERIGRVCYKSEDKITEDGESAKKFCKMLIANHHEAMIEHSTLSVIFTCDRGVSHEMVRHRIASFAQESTRYVSYSNKNVKISSEEDVICAYNNGLSMKKISERSDGLFTEWDIYKILEKYDIERRSVGNRGLVNENYFEIIDTPEKAYLLGFIEADGNIRQELNQLTISQKEDEKWWLLTMLRDFIQPDAKSLNIHNKKICSDLYNKGIIPNKTYDNNEQNIDILWESIPEDYKFDFIRGLMDGDGCIRWFYQKCSSITKSCNISFIGCESLLKKVGEYIQKKFNYTPTIKKATDVWSRLYITDSIVGRKLCEAMYKNFVFPYGHSKTARYFEAFDLEIPYKVDVCKLRDFNVIIPKYEINSGAGGLSGKQLWVWGNAMLDAEIHYKNMIELGATPQIARSVLPNSTKTNITITANYREWRTFFKLRTANDAHPQIREVAIPLCRELQHRIPIVFDDIELPNA